ncbi:hypothetical protein RJT34_03476 [Clitoria ternatea]|uniref:Uncharacterized protein n=1 Tax=Clitoria ternatea TaxID=43366 RepID=A0AAN9Q2K1_CLITE
MERNLLKDIVPSLDYRCTLPKILCLLVLHNYPRTICRCPLVKFSKMNSSTESLAKGSKEYQNESLRYAEVLLSREVNRMVPLAPQQHQAQRRSSLDQARPVLQKPLFQKTSNINLLEAQATPEEEMT